MAKKGWPNWIHGWIFYSILVTIILLIFLTTIPKVKIVEIPKIITKIIPAETPQPEEETKPVFTPKLNLGLLSQEDILNLFKKSSKEFEKTGWYSYQYNTKTKNFYDKYGKQFFGYDPFNQFVYDTDDREVNLSHLRMYKISKTDYDTFISQRKEKDKSIDTVSCKDKTACNENLPYLYCISTENKKMAYYNWYADGYMLIARDLGLAMETFEKFYC